MTMSAFPARAIAYSCLVLLAACGSLPTINPDMAPATSSPQIDGARGPLTNARTREILARLQSGSQATNIFDRHLALEQAVSDSPLVAGNRVRLLEDGPDTYRAMFAAIRAARDHINLETYILEDDEVGRRFADALIEKQLQGVQVNLIRDSVGTLRTPPEFLQRLRDSGIRTLEFNPVNPLTAKAGWEVNQRDHRKLLIVDGQSAFLGGINISSVYSGGSFSRQSKIRPRRQDAVARYRPADRRPGGRGIPEDVPRNLAQAERRAASGAQVLSAAQPQGTEVVRAIASSPGDAINPIYVTLISAINSAETEIWLTNAYFVPDPQLRAALVAAAARGVDVRLVLPASTDSALVFHAGRASYDELLAGGVKIFERREALMHSKTAVIDGVWSTVGSTNLDWRSFLHNEEVNAVVLGTQFGDRMRAAFARDVASSEEITLEQWRRRPVDLRLKEMFSWLWQYWL